MTGIEVIDRDTFTCFPLRGIILNEPNKITKTQEV